MSGSAAMGSETRTATGRTVLASLVGTAIEFYDFYIYGTAAALVCNLRNSLCLAPVGSFLFGHFGDRYGRKSTLLLFSVLTDAQFAAWSWRLPFLASALLVAVGLYVRRQVGETPAFVLLAARAGQVRWPLGQVITATGAT